MRYLSGDQKLLNQLLSQQINYKSVQKFNVDVSGIISPLSRQSERASVPRTSQTRNRPATTTVTKDSNLNQIKTNIMHYQVAVKKKFSAMNTNAQPLHPQKGRIISQKIDYQMGLEKRRQEEEAQRKYQSGWKKPIDTEKEVSKRRSRKDWKTLRHLSRHEYHLKSTKTQSQSRPVSSTTKKVPITSQRPATDVLSEAQERL